MTRLLTGERIGKLGKIRLGCSATIFDAARQKVLLTRRADNGLWCLPGGGVDPGESVTEACEREVLEETGLQVKVVRLIGVYSSPHRLIEYQDGNRVQIVALNFEVEILGGELGVSDEVTQFGYFSPGEIDALEMMSHHIERIEDAFEGDEAAFVR